MHNSYFTRRKIIAYFMMVLLVFHLFSGNIGRTVVSAEGSTTQEPSGEDTVEPDYSVVVDSAVAQSAVVVTYSLDETTLTETYQAYRKVTNADGAVVAEGIIQLEKDSETSVCTLSEIYSNEVTENTDGKYAVLDGSYTVVYCLKSETGDAITEDKMVSFMIDSVPPKVLLTCEDEDRIAGDQIVCKLTVTDDTFESDGVHVYVKKKSVSGEEETTEIEDAVFENGVTKDLLFQEEGNYTIYADVQDKTGNRTITENVTFIIDGTAPVVSIDAGELIDGGICSTKTDSVIVKISVSDLNLLEDSCVVQVEKDGRKMNGIPYTWEGDTDKTTTLTFDSEYGDGEYVVYVEAEDVMGQSDSAQFAFVVDNTAISIEELKVNYEKFTVQPPNSVIYGNVTTYYLNDSAKVTLKVKEKNYVDAVVSVNTVKDDEVIDKQDLSMGQEEERMSLIYTEEGNYITSVHGVDGSGNEGDEVSVHYVIDKTAPVMNICQVVDGVESEIEANQLFSVGDNRLLRFEITDSNHDKSAYTIKITRKTDIAATTATTVLQGDDISWKAGNEPGELYFESDSLFEKEGQYTVTIAGKDLAGNVATAKKVTFYIDATAPVIALRSAVADGTTYGDTVRLQYEVYEFNYENTVVELEVSRTLDGVTEVTTETIEMDRSKVSFEYVCRQQGYYVVTVMAKDQAGNEAMQTDTSQKGHKVSFVVDKDAPALLITGVSNRHMTRQPVLLNFEITDRNHDLSQYRIQVSRSDRDGEIEAFEITSNRKTAYDTGTGWNISGCDVTKQNNYQTSRTLQFKEEGIYYITFDGEDKAGNKAIQQTITFTVDKTAPKISGLTYSDTDGILKERYHCIYSNKAILVEFQVKDMISGVNDKRVYITVGDSSDRVEDTQLYIAHKSVGNYYYVYIPTDLKVDEFDNTITIWASDRLSNEAHLVSSNIVYRTAKPTVQMTCDVDYKQWTNKDVTFHTTVTDEIAGLKEVVYKANGETIKKVTFKKLTYSYSYDLVATEEASKVSGYAVTVEVTNNSGTTQTAKRQVYIDKTKPTVQLSGVENGAHYRSNQSIVTNVSDVSYKNTNTVYYVTRTLDGKKTGMSVAAFRSNQYNDRCTRKLLREGQYSIYAITTDSAGNKRKSNTLSFVIDKTAPEVRVSGVANGTMSASAVTLQFTCVESFFQTNEVNIEIEKTIDGTTTNSEIRDFPKNAKTSTMQRSFTEDGTYKVTISAKDKAGNVASSQTLTFSVDTTKPIIRISGTNNYQMWSNPAEVKFSVEESYYADSNVTITGTRRNADGNVEVVELPQIGKNGKVSSLSQLFQEDGVYEFVITARDKAGNQDSKSIHFTVDQNAPEINGLAQFNGGYYQSFQLAKSLDDVFCDLTVVSYRMLLNGVEYNGTDVVEKEGKYNLYVEVEDELGHKNIQNIEFVVDHTPPKVIFSGVKEGELVEEEGVVSLTLTNADDEITAIRMNGVEYTADTRNLAYEEYGSYRVEVDCEDKAGNKVTRELYFVYSNPMTIALVTIAAGIFAIGMCIMLWIRIRRREKDEI